MQNGRIAGFTADTPFGTVRFGRMQKRTAGVMGGKNGPGAGSSLKQRQYIPIIQYGMTWNRDRKGESTWQNEFF